jgi:hypothetical protein
MSRTPAAHLARLKVTYQSWSIQRAPEGGFIAEYRNDRGGLRSIFAPTLAELEAALCRGGGRETMNRTLTVLAAAAILAAGAAPAPPHDRGTRR